MNDTVHITDEELTAFLDGELDDARASAIEAALQDDRDLQIRRDGLALPRAAMDQAFDRILQQAPAMPVLPPVSQAPRTGLIAAGFAACLAAGTVIGMSLRSEPETGWVQQVATYQALYVAETLANADPSPEMAAAQLDRYGKIIERDLMRAADLPGVSFKRAQRLGLGGKPLVQIAYLSQAGDPVALCIIRNGKADAPVSYGAVQGMAAGRWNEDGYGFLVIGGDDDAVIRAMIDTFRG